MLRFVVDYVCGLCTLCWPEIPEIPEIAVELFPHYPKTTHRTFADDHVDV